jgi:hypothetical protein
MALYLIQIESEPLDVGTPPRGCPEAEQVEGPDAVPGRGQEPAGPFIAARVLAKPVDDHDVAHGGTRRLPLSHELGTAIGSGFWSGQTGTQSSSS